MKVLTLLVVLLAATVSSANLTKIPLPPKCSEIRFSSQGEKRHLEILTVGPCTFNVRSIEVKTFGECKFSHNVATIKQENALKGQQHLTQAIQTSNSDAESIDIQYDISSKWGMFKIKLIWPAPNPYSQYMVKYDSDIDLWIESDLIEVAPHDTEATYLCLRPVNATTTSIKLR